MSNRNTNLWAGLLQGYAQSSQLKKDRMERDEMKKLQIKMFKDDLDRKEKEESALSQIFKQMKGVENLPPDFTGPPQETSKKSILDILADPQGQALLMQAGMKPQDIISAGRQSTPFDISQLPPGMALSGVKITPDGQPMYDFSIPKIDELRDKATVEKEVADTKRSDKAKEMVGIIGQANKLLDDASGGYLETGFSVGKQAINFSDKTTQANQKLKLISGWLVNNVPRMEGPQGVLDLKNYEKMAGQIADSTLPIEDRKAALVTLLELQNKYIGGTQPSGPSPPKIEPQPGDVEDGYRFKGGDKADPKNWEKI